MDERIRENMEVFERSSFFSMLMQSAAPRSGAKQQMEEPTTSKRAEEKQTAQREESEEARETVSVSWEKTEPIPAQTSFEEQRITEVERTVPQGLSVQQVSDEMERLSQRYGRGMEEWLYDQSAL